MLYIVMISCIAAANFVFCFVLLLICTIGKNCCWCSFQIGWLKRQSFKKRVEYSVYRPCFSWSIIFFSVSFVSLLYFRLGVGFDCTNYWLLPIFWLRWLRWYCSLAEINLNATESIGLTWRFEVNRARNASQRYKLAWHQKKLSKKKMIDFERRRYNLFIFIFFPFN